MMIVTVDADSLKRNGASTVFDLSPILIQKDDGNGAVIRAAEVELPAGAKVVYGPPTRSGARVWIEAPSVKVLR